MTIKAIIKESISRNPTGLREALEEELRARIAVVLEAKKESMSDEDEDEDLDEASGADSIENFMKLMKLKNEPKKGARLNFAGYPFDWDDYDGEGSVYIDAVDADAAKGLIAEFKKKGFKTKKHGKLGVEIMVAD